MSLFGPAATCATEGAPLRSFETTETLVLRFGLFAAGVLSWRAATTMFTSGISSTSDAGLATQLLLYLWGFLLFVTAVARPLHPRAGWLIPVSLVAATGVYLWNDATNKLLSGAMVTTDGRIYLDYAARLLRRGINPYGQSMLEAYRMYRFPLSFSTPLVTGDLTDRLPYPALSFLVFVPFQWLGIPTYLVYFVFFCGALALLYRHAPAAVKPLVLLPFFAENEFFIYSLGGVSDTFWMFLLLLCVATWRRAGLRRALWYGLACSTKQHPWTLAPFLVIRIWLETPGSRGEKACAVGSFLGVAAGVFALVNAPFAVWDFPSWLMGCLEPLRSPMIAFGQGLTALTIQGIVDIPRRAFTVLQWGVLGLAAWAYGRHFRTLKPGLWLAPSVAMWFSHRSLTSYWYFNIFPLLLDLMLENRQAPTDNEGRTAASWKTTASVAGVAAALMAAQFWWVQTLPKKLEILSVGPARTFWRESVAGLYVHLRNNSATAIKPSFTVHGPGQQPLRWRVVSGPTLLRAGQEWEYYIQTVRTINEFNLIRSARVTVTEDGAYEPRATVLIPGDPSSRYPDAIPNGRFVAWTGNVPALWSLDREDGSLATATPVADSGAPGGFAVELSLPEEGEGRRVVGIFTRLMLPERQVEISVRVPAGANIEGDMRTLYGINLRVRGQSHLVLFGDREQVGEVDGARYLMLQAPRERWSTHRLDLRAILARLGANLTQRREYVERFEHLDLPASVVDLQLFLSATQEAPATRALFGPIANEGLGADPERMTDLGLKAEAEVLAWRGSFNQDMGNYLGAIEYFSNALALEPRGEFHFGLAEAAFWAGRRDVATQAFRAAIAAGFEPGRSYKGLGWLLFEAGENARALESFRTAAALLDLDAPRREEVTIWDRRAPAADLRVHLGDALKGCALTAGKMGDCDTVAAIVDRFERLNVGVSIPADTEAGRCLGYAPGARR